MRRTTDFTMLNNVVTSLGIHASRGREHCPEKAIRPIATIAKLRAGGFLLYLHTGVIADRDAERSLICDLEAAMIDYGVEFEALGYEYQGGAAFYVYRVEE